MLNSPLKVEGIIALESQHSSGPLVMCSMRTPHILVLKCFHRLYTSTNWNTTKLIYILGY